MRENKIGGIPVIDGNGKLVGIITNRDLRFQKDMALPIEKIMTKENLIYRSGRNYIRESRNFTAEL